MKIVLLNLSFWFCFISFAQNKSEILIPFLKDNLYGYINEHGKLVIRPKFEKALPFYSENDLTSVIYKGKGFFIDRKGKKKIQALPDISGYSDSSGYDYLLLRPEKVALDNYTFYAIGPRLVVLNTIEPHFPLDKTGNLCYVRIADKACLVNSNGKQVSKLFHKLRHFRYGEIEFTLAEDTILEKCGLIDQNGKQVLECVYDQISYSGKGQFELKQGGMKYPFRMDYNKFYIPKELPRKTVGNNYSLKRKNAKLGLIDTLQQIILPFDFDKLFPLNEENLLFIKNDTVGLVNIKEGIRFHRKIINAGHAPYYVPFAEEHAFLSNGNNWLLVDLQGKVIMENIDGIFVDFQGVNNFVAGICINKKIGLIDKTGKQLLHAEFDTIICISDNNSFITSSEGIYSWLDANGKIITDNFTDYKYLLKNYLYIKKGKQWYFVSDKGQIYQED